MTELPAATIVITSKNRRDELRRALTSCIQQEGSVETLVFDDGSTDGTSEMVASEFPQIHVHRESQSLGLIDARSKAASIARGTYIISIDDDAEFSTPTVVKDTLATFDLSERIGAVAIPYIDVRKSDAVQQRSPDEGLYAVSTYRGTAHCLRRDLFLDLGGYRSGLVRQNEESDYCIRMLEAGYFVVLGKSDPVLHHESPKRVMAHNAYYAGRNNILFIFDNIPLQWIPAYCGSSSLKMLRWGRREGLAAPVVRGLIAGYWQGIRSAITGRRKPVSIASFRLFRKLRRRGAIPCDGLWD